MPTPLLAELDPVQIAIVVIAVLGGFFQWLWSLIQQGKTDAEQRKNAETPEERKLREEAWRRQTQTHPQTQAPRPTRPAPSRTPPPVNDPFASVREIFDEIKRQAQGPQPPAAPPPLPPSTAQRQPQSQRPPQPPSTAQRQPYPPVKRGSVRADLDRRGAPQPAKRHSVAAEFAEATAAYSSTPPISLPTAPEPPMLVPLSAAALPTVARPTLTPAWAALLGSPAALRQAFILREILGPPKALQNPGDSAA